MGKKNFKSLPYTTHYIATSQANPFKIRFARFANKIHKLVINMRTKRAKAFGRQQRT